MVRMAVMMRTTMRMMVVVMMMRIMMTTMMMMLMRIMVMMMMMVMMVMMMVSEVPCVVSILSQSPQPTPRLGNCPWWNQDTILIFVECNMYLKD